ncbi:MAG: DapH/DapD/GlmU-related protein [Gemmatimonadota bacterium]|nr:DapH/DapD/GlmU-related protein [Gemmatimonadota bacterium]
MNTGIAVVIIFPEEQGILKSEIAGRPAGEFLLENLNACDEVDVKTPVNGEGGYQPTFEKFPNISQCKLSELLTEEPADRGLLIIDARAWLSGTGLADVLSKVRSATTGIRIVESNANALAACREAMTLAVYLPPEDLRPDLFVGEYTAAGQGLESVLGPGVMASTSAIACTEPDDMPAAAIIDSFADLAEIERRLLLGRATAAMKHGVRVRDPNTVYIRGSLVCGAGVEIEPNVIIEGQVVVGHGARIGANSILRSCRIGDNAKIHPFSLVEDASIGANSFVGPYGRVRPGSVIGDNVQIGNYVEIKNSRIGAGSRINHHTFIGDAILADEVTIGAGTITCNHDGFGTNQTVIERGAYVGSGCNLVAPLHIGQDAVIGAGSTIASDVPAMRLSLARERQVTVEGWTGPKSRRQRK